MSEQPGRYQRSPNAMIGALLVLLVVIAAFVGLRAISRDNEATPVATVDYVPVLKQARADRRLLAPAPDPMPKGWRATSVRFVPGPDSSWHLGILTDKGKYVGIEESGSTVGDKVGQFLGSDATKGASVPIGKRRWQAWSLPDGNYALTSRTGTGSIWVGGSAGERLVRELTGELSFAMFRASG
ncbi:MAG: DUF4245 domain-containing protein [Marmoricola sp.]